MSEKFTAPTEGIFAVHQEMVDIDSGETYAVPPFKVVRPLPVPKSKTWLRTKIHSLGDWLEYISFRIREF